MTKTETRYIDETVFNLLINQGYLLGLTEVQIYADLTAQIRSGNLVDLPEKYELLTAVVALRKQLLSDTEYPL